MKCEICCKKLDNKEIEHGCVDCHLDSGLSEYDFKNNLIVRLKKENKILREALKFYANGIVQKDDYSEHKSISIFSFTGLNRKNSGYGETEFVEQRFGKRAREALAKGCSYVINGENEVVKDEVEDEI